MPTLKNAGMKIGTGGIGPGLYLLLRYFAGWEPTGDDVGYFFTAVAWLTAALQAFVVWLAEQGNRNSSNGN